MSLRILTTGGTFDKRYDPITGQLGFAASAAPDLLERARLAEAVTLEALMALDSLDMTDTHRQDRKSTRLNSSHVSESRMPSSA